MREEDERKKGEAVFADVNESGEEYEAMAETVNEEHYEKEEVSEGFPEENEVHTDEIYTVEQSVEDNDKHQFCANCGQELKGQRFCPNCGAKIGQDIADKPKKKKSKKLFIAVIVMAVLIVCGIGGYFYYNNVVVPKNKYDSAVEKVKNMKFDEAITIFEKLGDYEDSKEKIIAAYYAQGEQLELAENYNEAIGAFKKAGNYLDSAGRIEEIKEKQRIILLKKKLKKAYDSCESKNTVLSSDGLSIIVDSINQYDYQGILDIMNITIELDMPDSLFSEMNTTNALMGRQTETYDGIEVSWSYHPDNGLDAVFKIIQ